MGMEGIGAEEWGGVSLILGMVMVWARWSLWLVSEVVMVASKGWKCAVGERRRIQWSSGSSWGCVLVCGGRLCG